MRIASAPSVQSVVKLRSPGLLAAKRCKNTQRNLPSVSRVFRVFRGVNRSSCRRQPRERSVRPAVLLGVVDSTGGRGGSRGHEPFLEPGGPSRPQPVEQSYPWLRAPASGLGKSGSRQPAKLLSGFSFQRFSLFFSGYERQRVVPPVAASVSERPGWRALPGKTIALTHPAGSARRLRGRT